MKLENPITQLFVKFILNHCTPDEIAEVQNLVRTGGYDEEWRAAMEETEGKFADADHSDLILNETGMFEHINTEVNTGKRAKLSKRFSWITAAAVIVLAVSVGLLLLKPKNELQKNVVVKKELPESKTDSTHRWIKLSDGSSVQLNLNSYLEYPDTFDGKASREVRLIGEAYFDIKHDHKHPFVIHTGKIKTTVLGTAFNIKAYHADRNVTVTVTRGKVKVEDEKKVLAVLIPDQQLTWSITLPEALKIKVNAAQVVEWKKQDLIMDDISLEEAAQMIAERYNVKIQFNNEKVKTCHFTAAFLNRNDITQVLSVVGDITGAILVLKNNTVIIDGPGC